MKKSKHTTFIESLANVYNKLYNSERLYESEDGWDSGSGEPEISDSMDDRKDPKSWQEAKIIRLVNQLLVWLDKYGQDVRVRFNPKGVNCLDAFDLVDRNGRVI